MAVRGQKAKNVGVKKTKKNPTRTKVKTPNISPKQVSQYKNDATKATSKAILQVERVTGTGPRSRGGGVTIKYDRGHLGKRYAGPSFQAKARTGRLRSTLSVVKRVRKNK